MTDAEKIVDLKRWIGIIIDAAVDQGNGESIVPTEDLEDAQAAAFGKKADTKNNTEINLIV